MAKEKNTCAQSLGRSGGKKTFERGHGIFKNKKQKPLPTPVKKEKVKAKPKSKGPKVRRQSYFVKQAIEELFKEGKIKNRLAVSMLYNKVKGGEVESFDLVKDFEKALLERYENHWFEDNSSVGLLPWDARPTPSNAPLALTSEGKRIVKMIKAQSEVLINNKYNEKLF